MRFLPLPSRLRLFNLNYNLNHNLKFNLNPKINFNRNHKHNLKFILPQIRQTVRTWILTTNLRRISTPKHRAQADLGAENVGVVTEGRERGTTGACERGHEGRRGFRS